MKKELKNWIDLNYNTQYFYKLQGDLHKMARYSIIQILSNNSYYNFY